MLAPNADLASRNRPARTSQRLASIDALRGLVVLLLVPDVYGGFSFYAMAKADPGSQFWAVLAGLTTHVPWSGASLWDMIMPTFVFLVGVSLALSTTHRINAGDTPAKLLGHAALRSLTLVVLGMVLQLRPANWIEWSLPYVLLATGLPWSRWLSGRGVDALSVQRADRIRTLEAVLSAAVVLSVGFWVATHLERLGNYDFDEILVMIGLAYLPTHLLAGRGLMAPARNAVIVLAAWALAFLAYSPPPEIAPVGEIYTGLLGHWNNGTNVAAALDRWFMNQLPRSSPYVGNAHGYQSLQFVPLIAQMLAGVVVGRLMLGGAQRPALRGQLLKGAALGLALSALLAVTISPLVKSLWTPSWAVFSTSVCVIALAALMGADHRQGRSWWVSAVTVLGSNTMLLYTISVHDRWRLTLFWERVLGQALTANPLRPVLESVLVLVWLWALAYALHRSRLHLRI